MELDTNFNLQGEYVTLGQLLKITGIIGSGGEARGYLAETPVLVNGETEQRRGRKLRGGDLVQAQGCNDITVIADSCGAKGKEDKS